jgi:uncharacterized membrane protein
MEFSPEDFDNAAVEQERSKVARREKFVQAERKSGSNSFHPLYVVIPALVLVIVGSVLYFQNRALAGAGGPATQVYDEVPIEYTSAGGKIRISADEVRKNKLVTFDYVKDGTTVPLTAWECPCGDTLKVAVRVCEPCNGYSFRREGVNLVCNTCGTKWDLETLKGISGGCTKYPPDVLPSLITGNTMEVDEAAVLAWKPRA